MYLIMFGSNGQGNIVLADKQTNKQYLSVFEDSEGKIRPRPEFRLKEV